MTIRIPRLRALLVLTLLLTLVLTACGKKGPVRPLQKPLPAAAQNLTLEQKGERFLLSWELPKKNQDGSELKDLAAFDVLRMEYDPTQDCPECKDTSTLLTHIELDYLRGATRRGNRLFLWDWGLESGTGYRYTVVPVTEQGHTGLAARVEQPAVKAPAAPVGVVAKGLDQQVRLTWEETVMAGPDCDLLGYNVFRRREAGSFLGAPVNKQLLVSPRFDDFGLENGVTYRYQLRSVAMKGGVTVESAPSETVEAVPKAGR